MSVRFERACTPCPLATYRKVTKNNSAREATLASEVGLLDIGLECD